MACDLIVVLLGDTDDDPDDHEGGGSANDEVVDVVVLNDGASNIETSDTDTVYGDSADGTGEFQSHLEDEGIQSKGKSQAPIARMGWFAKDRFVVILEDDTATCPNGPIVATRRHVKGGGLASSPVREIRVRSVRSAPSRPRVATLASG